MIKENAVKKSTPPPFLQALKTKKKAINQAEILEVLRQVKFNIPLLDIIKQVPTYAKILKDLCIVKRGLNVDKNAFLIEQRSSKVQRSRFPYQLSEYRRHLCRKGTARLGSQC